MTTPAIRYIRKTHPNAQIDFLTGSWSFPIIEHNPYIDKLLTVSEKIFFKKRLFLLFKLWLKLKRQKYDLIYNFHSHKLYSYYFYTLAKNIISPNSKTFDKGTSHVRAFLSIAGNPNPTVEEQKTDFFLKDNREKKVNFKTKKSIAINPGGGSNPGEVVSVRQWPKQYYVDLLKRFAKEDITFVFTGGSSDTSIASLIIKESELSNSKYLNLVGKTSLAQMKHMFESVDLIISGDTGGLHIAGTCESTPVVSIFGPTDPNEKAPLHHKKCHVFSPKLPCSPCYFGKFEGCIHPKPICMEETQVEAVELIIREILYSQNKKL